MARIRVFLAVSDERSTGTIDLGDDGDLYRISSSGDGGAALRPGRTSVFATPAAASAPPDVPFCAVEPPPGRLPTGGRAGGAEAAVPARGLKHLELAVETDYEYFVLFGDTTAALTYLVEMYAQVSDIYLRHVDTRIELVFARIWDDPDDLFNVVDPSPLGEFQSYWNANMGGVDRDVAQLFSGRRDYPFGGQAYLSSLCGSDAYSVVGYAMGFFPDPTRPSPYNYDILVTAHEIGHNAGTGHTQDYGIDTCDNPTTTPQRGPIMSYCGQTWSGGNTNHDLRFHSVIQGNMDAHLNAVSCVIDDCNLNGMADATDLAVATSQDVDANGIPDECEDCNGNLILDDADIAGASLDADGNGVPDECQPDCNVNGIPDSKDIADGVSTDAYGNDIPDECEADCDSDGTSDYTEIQLNMPLDIDRDAVLDACQDCDGDGTSDMAALGAAHRAWVASGLAASPIRQFHGLTGVLARTSGGAGAALTNEAQDLLAIPGGRVLVTSAADDRVMEFDTDGNYLRDLVPSPAGGLDRPTGMALAPGGAALLVASSGSNEVLAFDPVTGAPQGPFVSAGSGGLVAPSGMAFGPGGNLFVAGDDNQVREYDGGTGAFVRLFVSAGANGGLLQPRGIAFKPDGDLLVTSYGTNQTLAFDGASGAPLGRWALSGTANRLTQISPWGIRVGPNGNVFIVRTGEAFGSGGSGSHDLGDEAAAGESAPLHLTNAQVYEFDATNGNFLRAYINGNDHGMEFPSGFDFVPGWDVDCNLNQRPDGCDIAGGSSADLDSSGVPDECETDCNGNGTWDRLDIIPYGAALDCNGNLTPDACDTAGGFSIDCTGNGVPDECEADCNANGVADSCDIDAGNSGDCNGNGVPDECDVADDLETDTGWTVGATGDTASAGLWTRVDPVGTGAQPEDDHTPAGSRCFVTGQGIAGGSVGAADVDGGATTLHSPLLDLSGLADVELGYWRWFSNNQGGNPGQDVLRVEISDDGGTSWTPVETVGPTGAEASGGWFFHRFRIADLVTPTATVRLRFIASDLGGGSIVEAAVDDLGIFGACCETNLDCDDGLPCTVDVCAGSGGCENSVAVGSCLIADACYLEGQENPGDDCEACDGSTPLAWSLAAPGEVQGLLMTHGGPTQLTWQAQGSAVYDVVGGLVTALRADGDVGAAQCLGDDVPPGGWDDLRPDPGPGGHYYYLMRATKSCGAGTYGSASSGAERLPLSDCP